MNKGVPSSRPGVRGGEGPGEGGIHLCLREQRKPVECVKRLSAASVQEYNTARSHSHRSCLRIRLVLFCTLQATDRRFSSGQEGVVSLFCSACFCVESTAFLNAEKKSLHWTKCKIFCMHVKQWLLTSGLQVHSILLDAKCK